MAEQFPSEPIFDGDPEDKVTHRACGKREAFMPQWLGNLFYWYCPACQEWFVPARSSVMPPPVQCKEATGSEISDIMRVMVEPMVFKPQPCGVDALEAFYVIRKDDEEGVWRLVKTPAGVSYFETDQAAREAARAAADRAHRGEVRVLRCAQEVVEVIPREG